MYQAYLNGAAILQSNLIAIGTNLIEPGHSITNLRGALIGLVVLLALLMLTLYVVRFHTVRIYNWNGKRYCYLGHAGLHRNGGGYQVRIGERMADLSSTTLYQLCPSKYFVRRNRYKNMMLCAGNASCLLPIEGCMRQSIYYK